MCGSGETIKWGSRRGQRRFWCAAGKHSFSIDYRAKPEPLWIPHIDGVPLRKLGDEHNLSPSQTYARVIAEFNRLPENTALTKEYCDRARFCGILVVDGKFVKVRKFEQKIPFIFGIDYLSHDIPVDLLATAEATTAFDKLFSQLASCQYPLKIVVADDRSALAIALKRYYPDALIQRCQAHYLENIRQALHLRTDQTHHHFFNSLKKHVFDDYENDKKLNDALHHVLTNRCEKLPIRQAIVTDIDRRRKELFAYTQVPGCPKNTNLIELYNSHLNGRLKTIKGFKSFHAAERWLNAYLIRRRTKPLTDCQEKFKKLNGFCSLQLTLKKQASWPVILGVKRPKNQPETER